ncbi:hypothetical protein E2562_012530 [Oryza meyeriana var. granulata]|uniref:DUF1645 domain-containing protein n=1 Tax=Oryza meyeriana var. granulata TaxID=110450 RepID=A0A6G1D3K3_9ORYZ|nr:hypothetical protein E2562_012530 [Oryza meyeriana var. granulata]
MEERPRDRTRREPTVEKEGGDAAAFSGDESDGEFEFPFVSRETDAGGVADELFADGRIRAFYPVFGRVFDDVAPAATERRPPLGRLFLEEGRNSSVGSTTSTSSSSTDTAELDGVSPDSYCIWVPGSSPASSPSRPPRKGGSTGSIARWRRISELVIGRSHSDGKEKFRFLSAPSSPAREHSKAKPTKGASKFPTELDTIAAGHRMSYSPNHKTATGAARRTFLPYRPDLMGIFANVNGLSRTHHRPF